MTPLKNPNARFHEHKEMARASLFDFFNCPFSQAQVPVFTSTSTRFHGHKHPFSRAQAFDTILKICYKDILKEVKMNFKTSFLTLMFVVIFCSGAFSKNIAVIPFTNITQDGSKDWIGAVFSETLTTKLGKVKSINLIEREQLSKILKELKFQYSGFVDEKTAIEVGKIYGIDIMVLGSFQIIGDSLRASARFVDVQTGKIIDTAETTGNIQDIFKLQDEIAFSLLNSLNIVLKDIEKEEIKINPTENLTAYEWFAKGYKAYDLEEYDIAIEYYTNAIKIDIEFAEAYNNRGNAYDDKGLYDEAINDYTKAIKLNPKYAVAYYNRGIVYGEKGLYDEAIEDYNKAIELNPEYAEAYYNRGLAYYNKELYDEAIEDYNKAIELNPEYADAYYNRGNAYNKKGDYNSAISDFNKAIQINPQDAPAYYNRGNAYNKKGDYNSAIFDYTKAIEIDPQYAKAYYNRGVAYEKLGNCTKANADYKKACELGYEEACSYTCH